MRNNVDLQGLTRSLQSLQGELDDLMQRWPAHSVKPEMITLREDLEEEINRIKTQIKNLE